MKTKKIGLVVACLVAGFFFSFETAYGQRYRDRDQYQNNSPEPPITQDSLSNQTFGQRLVKGANFWLGFQPAYIEISPILGYKITPSLQAGIGFTYIYFNGFEPYYDAIGNYIGSAHIEGNYYGGRVYAEYDFLKNALNRNNRIYAHAEYETMNVSNPSAITGVPERTWYYSQYIGLGYGTPLGKKAYFNLTVLFNANFDQFAAVNPFGSPLVERIGITF